MQVGAFRGLNLAAKATLHYVRLVTSLAVFLENRFPEGAHIGHTRDTADEFRTAFAADKLTPYTELVRLCLTGGGAGRFELVALAGRLLRRRSRPSSLLSIPRRSGGTLP